MFTSFSKIPIGWFWINLDFIGPIFNMGPTEEITDSTEIWYLKSAEHNYLHSQTSYITIEISITSTFYMSLSFLQNSSSFWKNEMWSHFSSAFL